MTLAYDSDRLSGICRRFGIRELSLFGSAARGTSTPSSDVDLLIEYEPGRRPGFIEYAELRRELEETFGRPVDLVEGRASLHNPFRRKSILESMERLYAA